MIQCKSIDCTNSVEDSEDFCAPCKATTALSITLNPTVSMSAKYPKFYKDVGDYSEVDVYAVLHIFNIQDSSGCIQDASKKLLMSGSYTDKAAFNNITEARDTLSRWLELNPEGAS